jgi:hypothetical protein
MQGIKEKERRKKERISSPSIGPEGRVKSENSNFSFFIAEFMEGISKITDQNYSSPR